jgi:hypothetical protein
MFDSNGGDDDVDIGTDAAKFTALLPSCWQPCAVTALTRTLLRSTLQPAARRLSLKIGLLVHVSFSRRHSSAADASVIENGRSD